MCYSSMSLVTKNSSDENELKDELFAKLKQNLTWNSWRKCGFFNVFLCFFVFHILLFEDFHIKNCGHYFNVVPLFCSILVNPNLTFFDVKNNFELPIILNKVYFRIFFVSKWTNLTSFILVRTLLIFKRETPTYFLHIYQNTGSCWWHIVYCNFEPYISLYFWFSLVVNEFTSCMSSHWR